MIGLILAEVLAVALLFYGLRWWQDRDPIPKEEDPESGNTEVTQAIGVVGSLLDQVRAEPDPRLAIQKAWAAAESGFGQVGLAREAAETPAEYLDRTVGVAHGLEQPLGRLVQLFELARFSRHPISQEMRTEAIQTLVTIKTTMEQQAQPDTGQLVGAAVPGAAVRDTAVRDTAVRDTGLSQ